MDTSVGREASQSDWVTQSVKCLTLDVGSGHELRAVRSALGMEPA